MGNPGVSEPQRQSSVRLESSEELDNPPFTQSYILPMPIAAADRI